MSKYQEIDPNGMVEPFIPFLCGEAPPAGSGDRVVLWIFGGCVELEDRTGRVWFEKSIFHADDSSTYYGTGIAKVMVHWYVFYASCLYLLNAPFWRAGHELLVLSV